MYFITYLVLSVLLPQQTVSSHTIEFYKSVNTHTVAITHSLSGVNLFIVSPNYPANYNITQSCAVSLKFTLDQPFSVYIEENVSSCDTLLLYQVTNFMSNRAFSCTSSTAGTSTRVHHVIFHHPSNSDTTLISLNKGAAEGLKLSVAISFISMQSSSTSNANAILNSSLLPTTMEKISPTPSWPVSSPFPNQMNWTSTTTSLPPPGFFSKEVNQISVGVGFGGLILVVVIIVLVVLLKRQRSQRKPSDTSHQNVYFVSGLSNNGLDEAQSCSNAGSETTSDANAYADITLQSPHASTADTVQPVYVQSSERDHQPELEHRDKEVFYTPIVKKIQLIDNELYDTA